MSELEELRVAGNTSPQSLAGAIASIFQKNKTCTLTAIGAGPVNQTVKAITIARGMLSPLGKDLWFKTGFLSLDLSNEEEGKPEVTAIKFFLEVR